MFQDIIEVMDHIRMDITDQSQIIRCRTIIPIMGIQIPTRVPQEVIITGIVPQVPITKIIKP